MNLSNNHLLRGALAGVIATVPMSVAMNFIRSRLTGSSRLRPLPQEELIFGGVEHSYSPDTELAVDIPHYLYGGACGALFALLYRSFQKRVERNSFGRKRLRPTSAGAAYGFAVWLLSFLGWMPLVNASPKATNQSSSRNLMMIVVHLIWGTATARLMQRNVNELTRDTMLGITGKTRSARMMQNLFA